MPLDQELAAALIDGGSSRTHYHSRLLGARVRKFSYWHRVLLKAVKSPFIIEREDEQPELTMFDLRTAVGICKLRFGNSCIKRPWLVPTLIVIGAFLGSIIDKHRKVKPSRNALQRALDKHAEKFISYTGDYLHELEYSIIPPASSATNPFPDRMRGAAPDEMEATAEIIGWAKYPIEYVWDLPISLVQIYRPFCRRDAGMDVDFVTEVERKFRESIPPEFKRNG